MYNLEVGHFYKCDLTNNEMIDQTVQKIVEEFGHPTMLVNNAGIMVGGEFHSCNMSAVQK
jgi:NADP-dependent 3-hydroxy acid dehydrogenase YdfG